MMEEKKHHRLSMSQWSTLAVCPHFVPSQKPSDEANAGTEAHEEVEEIYKKVMALGEALTDIDSIYSACAKYENPSRPQTAWCAARWIMRARLEDIPEGERDNYHSACAVEMKLTIQDTDPLIDGIYGYADFVRLLRRKSDGQLVRITVADFKTFSDGTRQYDEQLAGYAVAVASTIPNATDDVAVELITNHGAIRADSGIDTTLGECRRTAVDVVQKYLCRERFEKVLNPKCKYCKHYPCAGAVALAKAVDPTFEKLKISEAELDANPESVPVVLSALEEVQKLVDATRATAVEIIKKHGERTISNDGLERWTVGDDTCKYEVRQSLGSRKVESPQNAFDVVCEKEKLISLTEFLGACTVKVSGLESALKKATEKKPNEVKQLMDDLGLVSRGATTTTLKRIA